MLQGAAERVNGLTTSGHHEWATLYRAIPAIDDSRLWAIACTSHHPPNTVRRCQQKSTLPGPRSRPRRSTMARFSSRIRRSIAAVAAVVAVVPALVATAPSAAAAPSAAPAAAHHTISYDNYSLMIDGKRTYIWSG